MPPRRQDARIKLAALAQARPQEKRRAMRAAGTRLFSFTGIVLAAGLAISAAPHAPELLPHETITLAAPVAAPELHAVTEEDLQALAATTWAEARSEGADGMRAVAHVIVNRVGPRFGGSIREVVRSPWQFSAWNRGDPNRPLALDPERYAKSGVNRDTWEQAQEIAREVATGRSVDPTNGALFYHTTTISPYWASYGVGAQTIGRHIFYADVLPVSPRHTLTAG